MSSEINGQRKADFSHFLDANLWFKACKLLDFQINEKILGKNKYYKTLGMFLYERHGLISDSLTKESYFPEKISNCFFYGIPEEFYVVQYANPKPGFGHRNYKYFSAPIRAIYYSVCLYVLKISQEFLSEYYRKNKKISSFYGGSLTLSKEFALNINKQSIVYYDSYKEYRKKLKKEAKKTDNKVIIRFYIQNFYDNFSPKILLANLDEMIKPSNKNAFNFDNYTAEQILSFFAFMSAFKGGLPQTDNDVCSNFLGWLYLVFSDLKIDDELKLSGLFLKDYQLVRYVDDHFLILTFRDSLSVPDKNMFCEKLMSKISDLLYFDFGLKLNHKTSIYWLEKQEDLESFHLGIKRISQNYEIPSDEDLSFKKKVDGIFEVLSKINNPAITDAFAYQLQDIEEEKLRAIFDHGVID
jgi:AbiA family abortive infection protein